MYTLYNITFAILLVFFFIVLVIAIKTKSFKIVYIAFKNSLEADRERNKARFRETIEIFKEWYSKIKLLWYEYQKSKRFRTIISPMLENDMQHIISDYAYAKFDTNIITVINSPISFIKIEFKMKSTPSEEQIYELTLHLKNKVNEHWDAENKGIQIFSFYLIDKVSVNIEICYCEYADELSQFYEYINRLAFFSAEQKYGALEEDRIKLMYLNNSAVLGADGEKWLNSGFVAPVVWNCTAVPHLCVSGATGSGKSVLTQQILKQLLFQKKDVIICDYKAGKDWSNILPTSRYATYKDCDRLVNKFFDEFQKALNKEIVLECGQEKFLVFDEVSSYLMSKKKSEYEAIREKFYDIATMGREYGFHLIFIGQQFNAKVIDTAIREQFGIKIHMGHISSESATMLFPGNTLDKNQAIPKYCGYMCTPTSSVFMLQTATVNPIVLKKDLIQLGKFYFDAEQSSAEVVGV